METLGVYESLLLAGEACSEMKHHNATMSSMLLHHPVLLNYKLSFNVFYSSGNLELFKR